MSLTREEFEALQKLRNIDTAAANLLEARLEEKESDAAWFDLIRDLSRWMSTIDLRVDQLLENQASAGKLPDPGQVVIATELAKQLGALEDRCTQVESSLQPKTEAIIIPPKPPPTEDPIKGISEKMKLTKDVLFPLLLSWVLKSPWATAAGAALLTLLIDKVGLPGIAALLQAILQKPVP